MANKFKEIFFKIYLNLKGQNTLESCNSIILYEFELQRFAENGFSREQPKMAF